MTMQPAGVWPQAALQDALSRVGMSADKIVRGTTGHCATFANPDRSIFIRVGRPGSEKQASQGIQFAHALAGIAPVQCPVPIGPDQPICTPDGPVSFWPLLQVAPGYEIDLRWFGAALRKIHDTDPVTVQIGFPHRRTPPKIASDRLERFSRGPYASESQVADATSIFDFIHASADLVLPKLRRVLIHGDAYPGNVVITADGDAVLVDYDSAGIGPSYWDLAPVAVLHRRFGLSTADFEAFLSGYGTDSDPRNDPLFDDVVRIREWGIITPLLDRAGFDPVFQAELHMRISSRFDPSVRWTPREILERIDSPRAEAPTETHATLFSRHGGNRAHSWDG